MRKHPLDSSRLREIVKAFPRSRVTVVGDLIVDHYIWGRVQRISPEAPVPVVEVGEENRRPGGAANVAANIRSLGGGVRIVGAVGNDEAGLWLAEELTSRGIGIEGLRRLEGRPTSVKTRIVAHSQQVVRVDRETRDHLPPAAGRAVREHLSRSIASGGTVVVSDYGKGIICAPLLELLKERMREGGLRVLVDPKSRHFSIYRGFTLVTPNQREAEAAANIEITGEESLRRAGARLLEVLESDALLITRGEAGMALFTGGEVALIPTMAREVYDVTGAGDTVLATLALALDAGATFLEAAVLANLAAGIVVGEVGTSTVTAGEVLAAMKGILPVMENGHG